MSFIDEKKLVTAVVADEKGDIFDLPGYAAVGMAGTLLVPLHVKETVNMPFGSELMMLPDRKPVLYNIADCRIETISENPYSQGESVFPVAVFNSPGYVLSYNSAYAEDQSASYLPLFSYGATGWLNGEFRSSAILVDKEKRQDIRLMKSDDVFSGIERARKKMPNNRLVRHLEKCASVYGCPAGKNFFLRRYEAPLPVSRHCNAKCIGCLSLQKGGVIPNCQDRISFTPEPEEVSEIAVEHIGKVERPIVSFGQGCEGDPLLEADIIESAIRMIRLKTDKGTININTNGGIPSVLSKLFDAGLDSIRISMNSVREKCYNAYFRPQSYNFGDVKNSIEYALERGKFVSINYLNCPGFTDTPEEFYAFIDFLTHYPVHFIQWRNLNFDPVKYIKIMFDTERHGSPIGMKHILSKIKKNFPNIKFGYFNPPKESFHEQT